VGTEDLDGAYGRLATYVTEHAVAVNGLIHEYYLLGPRDTDDESAWRTEAGWPIFEPRSHSHLSRGGAYVGRQPRPF
jgi:hypothetical protein